MSSTRSSAGLRILFTAVPLGFVAGLSLLLPGCGRSGTAALSPEELALAAQNWSLETPVADVVAALGGETPSHGIDDASVTAEAVEKGRQLIFQGYTTGADGERSERISHYFICTDCHNTRREDPALTSFDPEARLAYVAENKIPLLQGSTFAGIVNRESWYNDDYAKKYAFSLGVQLARKNLRKSTQLCSKECSQGRNLEQWEEDAIMAWYLTLQWTLGDLDLTDADLAAIKRDAAAGDRKKRPEIVSNLQGRYPRKSPATFGDPPEDPEAGYENLKGDPDSGERVFRWSCLHCHGKDGVSETWFSDKPETFRKLSRNFGSKSNKSLYNLIRIGTHSTEEKRAYMPNYPKERLSDQQIENLRAYIVERAEEKE